MIAMGLFFLIFVCILTEIAIESDIKKKLRLEISGYANDVMFENGSIVNNDKKIIRQENIYLLIIDKDGDVKAGKYPNNVSIPSYKMKNGLNELKIDGEKYYVLDRFKTNLGENYFVRAVVRKGEISSDYFLVRNFAYIVFIVMSAAIIVSGIILSKKMIGDLGTISDSASHIGNSSDLSYRVDYKGKFKELIDLANANNRMLDNMNEIFREQEQFTSDVAHELRTPVAVIMAQCQHARKNIDDMEEMQETLNVIERQSKKMNNIVHTLLNMSRLDRENVVTKEETIDLVEIAQAICEDNQDKARDFEIQTEFNAAYTKGDINLIAIAVQNLVTNAIKFSDKSKKILVKTGVTANQVFVSVQDYGKGIPAHEQKNIFKRFYKEDESRNSSGFGLGLALTMKIAQKHGGTVTLESEQGKGSLFTLYLKKI